MPSPRWSCPWPGDRTTASRGPQIVNGRSTTTRPGMHAGAQKQRRSRLGALDGSRQ
ncbi:MAG: hypothetical protein IPI48_16065 [bacterium]|nr:hypothetical protein [bacterium]